MKRDNKVVRRYKLYQNAHCQLKKKKCKKWRKDSRDGKKCVKGLFN